VLEGQAESLAAQLTALPGPAPTGATNQTQAAASSGLVTQTVVALTTSYSNHTVAATGSVKTAATGSLSTAATSPKPSSSLPLSTSVGPAPRATGSVHLFAGVVVAGVLGLAAL
jgi:hypothetical protein